jgi:hypothetical protein
MHKTQRLSFPLGKHCFIILNVMTEQTVPGGRQLDFSPGSWATYYTSLRVTICIYKTGQRTSPNPLWWWQLSERVEEHIGLGIECVSANGGWASWVSWELAFGLKRVMSELRPPSKPVHKWDPLLPFQKCHIEPQCWGRSQNESTSPHYQYSKQAPISCYTESHSIT